MLLSLQEAAKQLGVSIEVLLRWNDYHILTPKITLTGEIGYTQEQIDQFLTIQHTLLVSDHAPQIAHIPTPDPQIVPIQTPQITHQRNIPLSPLLLGTIMVGSAIFFFVLFTQGGHLTSVLGSQTTQQASSNANSLHSPDTSTFAQNMLTVSPTPAPAGQTGTVKLVRSLQNQPSWTPEGAQDTSTFASIGQKNTPVFSSSTIDSKGNITGENGPSNTLATILGAGTMGNASLFQQVNTDTKNQIIFLLVTAMIASVLLMRRQKKVPAFVAQPTAEAEKIMEIHQKMDGTVVLSFQGKDYKISKPELDSDSDKFIERLMQLIQPGSKEIEYESLTDTIRLTTPLSRIVTRLGFVGIKRDLFFPRTSKHRVLFRKYITKDDLASMNLTTTQILQDTALIN